MAIYTVTNSLDDGIGSLRYGISHISNTTINFNKNIHLIELSSQQLIISSNITISGNSDYTTLTKNSNDDFAILYITGKIIVNLSNLRITNGNIGIIIDKEAKVNLNNVIITQNKGGITVTDGSTVNINNCIISENASLTKGGAIHISNSNLSMTNTNITANNSEDAGGAIMATLSNINIAESNIYDNTSNGDGGGICIDNCVDTKISKSNINNNHIIGSGNGGGIYLNESSLIMDNNSIFLNTSRFGAGLYSNISTLNISNSVFYDNNAIMMGGGLFVQSGQILLFINTTIHRNNAGMSGGGIYLNSSDFYDNIINLTISGNTATKGGGLIGNAIIHNTIVANNTGSLDPDASGIYTGSSYNLIGNGTGVIDIFNSIDGNIVGNNDQPVDPFLTQLGNYGGFTNSIALINGSPAINAGSIKVIPEDIIYDQRGPPYLRTYNNNVSIGAFEFINIFNCYSGDSDILIKHTITNEIKNIKARDLISGIHEVFNIDTQKFVPVKINIVCGLTNRFILIKKNSISDNVPLTDFYITPGHMVVINGKHVKARDIPSGIRVKTKPQYIYSICTQHRCPIIVNGMHVLTWSYNKWISYASKNGISWFDNKLDQKSADVIDIFAIYQNKYKTNLL